MKSDASPIKILVTGEYSDLDARFPSELGHLGRPLEWVTLPVLRFERLAVDEELLKHTCENPPDWIVFTSSRSVQFWSECLMEVGQDFPIQTQVACIGERTAEAAGNDGFSPDFYPTEPGTEKFLEEFEDLLSNNSIKPTILIPMAQGGRTLLAEKLRELGCTVTVLPLYRTLPREDVTDYLRQNDLNDMSLILFTSPSSVDAFTQHFEIPEGVKVGSIGRFTSEHLDRKGLADHSVLPAGDFERVGEILC